MSAYEPVKQAMAAGTPLDLICAACPWDRLCVKAPQMDAAEIDRRITEAEARGNAANGTDGAMTGALVTALIFAGKDTMGQMCPVLITRLRGREGRRISDCLREVMCQFGEVDR